MTSWLALSPSGFSPFLLLLPGLRPLTPMQNYVPIDWNNPERSAKSFVFSVRIKRNQILVINQYAAE